MAADSKEQVNGQMIPLDEDAMLVPNSAVLDVTALDLLQVRTSPPSWLLGSLAWRGQEVPVISVEGLLGREVPARIRRNRVVIVNGYGRQLDPGLFGVVSQGHSHLMTLNRVALHPAALESSDMEDYVLSRVRIANARAFIPDLDAIEARLAEAVAAGAVDSEWELPLDEAAEAAVADGDSDIVKIDF